MNIRGLFEGISVAKKLSCRNLVVFICAFMLAFVFCSMITQPVLAVSDWGLMKAPKKSVWFELEPGEAWFTVKFEGWYLTSIEITPKDVEDARKRVERVIQKEIRRFRNEGYDIAKGLSEHYEGYMKDIDLCLNYYRYPNEYRKPTFRKSYPVGTHKEIYAYTEEDVKTFQKLMLSGLKRRIDEEDYELDVKGER
ncbi:MAG: hypothetical protein SCARUB_04762 [Candidatus Scalindua rubra]|uniref:Uncharacterized protein n=1 Tax=Candidatus Scalindua rubra TaxID=1872076 RepID=A0A1E3X3C2_9BACT|nr:MAG: hypothetical protein SCARUB_04762 [Candidatus Scalindua rubra]